MIGIRQLCALALALAMQSGLAGICAAQQAPFWGDLEPGPHAVGFRSTWIFDHGRRYAIEFEDGSAYGDAKAPRPILVNVWYPAQSDPGRARMMHGDYLEIGSDDSRIAGFSRALAEYNLGIISEQVTGQPPDGPDESARSTLQQGLMTPTAAVRGAPPSPGSFPIVIYHAGHGSSFEDNAVLCEYLASHGYVVLGSAFQYGDGDGLGTDTRAGSMADVDALIRFAREIEGADWTRIGFVGHSGGAQFGLRYASRPGSAVDAFVLLDTTQDYHSLFLHLWDYPEQVLDDREYVTAPLLFAANPHAFFQVADSLSAAERYYLTIPDLAHNEFISQGIMAGSTAIARRGYEALVVSVRRFLDSELKDDPTALDALMREFGSTVIGGMEPHIEHVATGTESPPAYQRTDARPPSPRQFRPLLDGLGVDSTVALLRRFRVDESVTPILDSEDFQAALLFELVESGRREDAVKLYQFFAQAKPELIMEILWWVDTFSALGDDATAAPWLRVAQTVDPTHPEVIKR